MMCVTRSGRATERWVCERTAVPASLSLFRRHRRLPGESSDEGARPLAGGDHRTVSRSMFIESAWTTLLATCWRGGWTGKAATKGGVAETPWDVLYPFQKRPQWLKLWMHSQHSKCFWNRYNAAWPFRGGPSSGHAVTTAATVRCLGAGISSYLVTAVVYDTIR